MKKPPARVPGPAEQAARRPAPLVSPMPAPASALSAETRELREAQQGAGNAAMAAAARAAGTEDDDTTDILPSAAALYESARLALERRPEVHESGRPGMASAYDSIIAAANRPAAKIAVPAGDVPHRAEMEAGFGESFAGIEVQRGVAVPRGARAAAEPEKVMFAAAAPSRTSVAHELAHVVQHRRGPAAAQGVASAHADPAEQEARTAAAAVLAGAPATIQRTPSAHTHLDDGVEPGAAERTAEERARAIHDALHGSWFSTDTNAVTVELRGLSRDGLRGVRAEYLRLFDENLEEELEDIPAARALLWSALTVIERLALQLGFDDNEDGIMQALRTATNRELTDAAADLRIYRYLDELDDDQSYDARKLLWPDRRLEQAVWRLERAESLLGDDESALYRVILDLSPHDRRQLWYWHQDVLRFVDEGNERDRIRRMCVDDRGEAATEAQSLSAAMEGATTGLGTLDDVVQAAIGRAASVQQERQSIEQALTSGVTAAGVPLSADQRQSLEQRRRELGDMDALVSADSSFMTDLREDVGAGEYTEASTAVGTDVYQRARQQLIDAVSVFGDDEDAIYDLLRDVHAPLTPPEGRSLQDMTPAERQARQRELDQELLRRLRHPDPPDEELAEVWAALDQSELAIADDYASRDTYRVAVRELERAYYRIDTDEIAILRIAAGMSEADRERLRRETPDVYWDILTQAGLDERETSLFQEVLRTGRLPLDAALDVAMEGGGTDEELVNHALRSISDAERQTYRFGYWLDREQIEPDTDAGRDALAAYRALEARLTSELEDEDLDLAMTDLLGEPTAEEVRTGQGRAIAADILYHRHRERLELTGGWLDWALSSDDTARQALTIYESEHGVRRSDDMSMEDFLVLVGLHQEFEQAMGAYQQSVELIANIAGTIAATVIGIVIVVLSEGTLAPAAAKLIASWGGAALWAAVGGGTAMVGTREAIAGDFYSATGGEGARDFAIGAIEGATTVAASHLAAAATRMIGLSGPALSVAVTRAALGATEAGLATVGRAAAGASLEAAIDGFLSGAAGELAMTATDAQTWRRRVWDVLGSLGMSILRGGAVGGGAGLVTGGVLGGGGALRRYRGLRDIPTTWTDDIGDAAARVDYEGGVSLTLPRGIDDASLVAHADEALRLHTYSELRERIVGLLTRRRVFPPGTAAFEAQDELRKLVPIMDDRARALASGTLDPETAQIYRGQLDVMESRAERWRGVVEAGDVSPGTGSIGRPDAPEGFLGPPAGHYYARTETGWDIRRYPGARDEGVEPLMVRRDASGAVYRNAAGEVEFVPRVGVEAVARFPAGTTPDEAFELLAGPNSRSSFKPYFDMLQNANPPIASRDDIIAAMRQDGILARAGRAVDDEAMGASVDDVRHALKVRYRQAVLARMTQAADGTPLDQAASWARMREMTLPLNSSDRGNITEDWYAHWNAPGARRQVPIRPEDFPAASMTGSRRADLVHDGVLREVKSGDGPLSQHDLDQFADYMRVVRPPQSGGGATGGVIIGGEQVDEVVYVFTSPQAALINAPWIRKSLADHPHLTIQLYDTGGVAHAFNIDNLDGFEAFIRTL